MLTLREALLTKFFSRLIWATPYFKGKTRLFRYVTNILPFYAGEIKHHTGFSWVLDSKHAQVMFIYSCEPFSSKVLLKISSGINTFIDIGANRGWYSCLLRSINPNLEVHAFEPDEKIFKILDRNLSQFTITSKLVHRKKVAVGHCNGVANLATYVDGNDGMMTLYPQENMPIASNQIVETQTFDSYFGSRAADEFDGSVLMKIDVEGSELKTIQGAKEFISTRRPIIIMEINSLFLAASGTTAKIVLDFMNNLGYVSFWLDERGRIERCIDHNCPPHQKILDEPEGANYLFLHQDNCEKIVINQLIKKYKIQLS